MSPASRFLRVAAGAALAGAILVPVGGVQADGSRGGGGRGGDDGVRRIFVIMLENHSQSTVIGDPNAPFITSLARHYGQATNYHGVTHPSQPNYVAAITGQLDITRMNDVATNTYTWPNLVDQLEGHGKTWGAYMEALPYAGYTGATAPGTTALYSNKHDPFVLMTDVLSSPSRLANIKPYTSLATDLNSRHAPDFVWISPDQCNDMHGGVYSTVAGQPETDEADFSSTATTTDLWADVSGCCDSPGYGSAPALPYGYQFQDNGPGHFWYTGQFGGGLVPAIVVTREGERAVTDATPYNHY